MALTYTPPGEIGFVAPPFKLKGVVGTAPEVAGTAPEVAGTAPEVAGTAPEVAGTAPEVAGTAPENNERFWSLDSFSSAKALVVVFMCNHCPYVKAVVGRINALAREYGQKGVALVGINSNDPSYDPDDSFEMMKRYATRGAYVFPYLVDETQEVARAYGAVCTPDFYAFRRQGKEWKLAYRGRLDDNWKDEKSVRSRDLALALERVLAGQEPAEQPPSMGCNIKWKT